MAFQVKHVKVEKQKQQDGDGFFYVGIVDRNPKTELETPPPSLTTQDKKAYAGSA